MAGAPSASAFPGDSVFFTLRLSWLDDRGLLKDGAIDADFET